MVMLLITGIVFSTLILSLIAFPFPASAQKGPNFIPGSEVVGVFGKIPGQDLIVHAWVVVPPGADKNEVVSEVLRQQGARPWAHDEFSTTGLVWDQFFDSDQTNNFVTQNYNSKDDPTGGGLNALMNTFQSWNGVTTSVFEFLYGGETGRCPSLVRECPGPQKFDGKNDVAWLGLTGCCTLGVTWFGTSTDEADMALNNNFDWASVEQDGFDVETVFLHENGHVVGLGHSEEKLAVMYPSYQGVRQNLHQDDKDGIAWLYPSVVDNPPTVSITNPKNGETISGTVNISADASDSDGSVVQVEFFVDDVSVGVDSDGSNGWSTSWDTTTASDGTRSISATATDNDAKKASDSISVIVDNIDDLPSVSITNPIDGSTVSGIVTITADASDDKGVTQVEFFVDGASVGVDNDGSNGWSASWDSTTAVDGSPHNISAKATDTANQTTNDSINVTVNNSSPTTAGVDSITYQWEGGKNKDKHLNIIVHVSDNLDSSVSGASVSITLTNSVSGGPWSGTATTGSDGYVTFSLKNAPSGTYTTTITDVTASGLTWDGVTPLNSTTK